MEPQLAQHAGAAEEHDHLAPPHGRGRDRHLQSLERRARRKHRASARRAAHHRDRAGGTLARRHARRRAPHVPSLCRRVPILRHRELCAHSLRGAQVRPHADHRAPIPRPAPRPAARRRVRQCRIDHRLPHRRRPTRRSSPSRSGLAAPTRCSTCRTSPPGRGCLRSGVPTSPIRLDLYDAPPARRPDRAPADRHQPHALRPAARRSRGAHQHSFWGCSKPRRVCVTDAYVRVSLRLYVLYHTQYAQASGQIPATFQSRYNIRLATDSGRDLNTFSCLLFVPAVRWTLLACVLERDRDACWCLGPAVLKAGRVPRSTSVRRPAIGLGARRPIIHQRRERPQPRGARPAEYRRPASRPGRSRCLSHRGRHNEHPCGLSNSTAVR